ncbi:hypothetical protein KTO58_25455 [Chitinophaga pendula]|uniref:hypothetical protein n=1 Tax=Chitinophaga TaxID=79328 RepID=UPI000BAF21F9|nr:MULTISPECIES: hypothetical protein [Chitinophaga]ASZ10073.1 hypothetical protein CK934_03310 [Chitinophaga sp. MD30]UCJ06973.1 hypothetical protein KTO58_25455 [Chitinophaga pendula]
MKSNTRWACLLLLTAYTGIMTAACNTSGQTLPTSAPYRDLKQYFTDEMVHIRQNSTSMQKIVSLHQQHDTIRCKATDSTTLKDLLTPFLDADINKASLRGRYDSAVMLNEFNGSRSVVYTARTSDINPRQIMLELDASGQIKEVTVDSYTHNLVYEARRKLYYRQQQNVQINTYEKIAFLQPKELTIQVQLSAKQ